MNKDACRPRQDECPRSPGGPSQAGEGWLAGKTGRRPRVGGRWPRKKVRGCSVAAPRGEDRGEGAATHPGCRATRSRRREPGLDAAAHERCRFPAQASPGAGGGAPRRGGVPTWVGGRGPSRESPLGGWTAAVTGCGSGREPRRDDRQPGPDPGSLQRPGPRLTSGGLRERVPCLHSAPRGLLRQPLV